MKQTTANGSMKYAGAAEETLRLIASLPAPEGLEERVRVGLRAEPRRARVLHWPVALPGSGMAASWVRGAAAAAIVLVVAGGGWGIYTRVQTGPADKVIAMPAQGGGFGSAGAMRTPDTLSGPMLHPATQQTATAHKPVASVKKPVENSKTPLNTKRAARKKSAQ